MTALTVPLLFVFVFITQQVPSTPCWYSSQYALSSSSSRVFDAAPLAKLYHCFFLPAGSYFLQAESKHRHPWAASSCAVFLVFDMAAPNTRVRVISTTELGTIRYKQLLSEGKWLVDFRHADGAAGASFGAAAVDANRPKLSVKSCSSPFTLTDSFVRARRGEWRLLAKIPAEEVDISVESGRTVIFKDKCTIAPPDAPLENNRAASSLKARSSSGAVQRSVADGSGASGAGGKTWPVDFVFSENVVGVREVFVVLEGDHDDVRCANEEGDDGREKYTATAHLPAGPCRYRFRIVLDRKSVV